jgi:TonB family protein
VSVLRHDARRLERSYYRRVEVAILLAVVIHAAAAWILPPYVPSPYTLDATPLRLVAAGRVDGTVRAQQVTPPASRQPNAPAARRAAVIVTEQLRFSTQAEPMAAASEPPRGAGESQSGSTLEGVDEAAPPVFYAFDSPPKILARVVPEYPALAKSQGREGSVILNANVDERGRVIRVWVVQATAPEVLIEAAIDALYRFRFAPGSQQGVPVKCTVAVPFNFHLNVRL